MEIKRYLLVQWLTLLLTMHPQVASQPCTHQLLGRPQLNHLGLIQPDTPRIYFSVAQSLPMKRLSTARQHSQPVLATHKMAQNTKTPPAHKDSNAPVSLKNLSAQPHMEAYLRKQLDSASARCQKKPRNRPI